MKPTNLTWRRLTVKYLALLMISNNYYKLRSHNSPRTTLPFSPLINAGKILIYANCDYHKLHFSLLTLLFCFIFTSFKCM